MRAEPVGTVKSFPKTESTAAKNPILSLLSLCFASCLQRSSLSYGFGILLRAQFLKWWSFEMLILLSGILQNPALETSVLSVWHIRRGLGYIREALSKLMDC